MPKPKAKTFEESLNRLNEIINEIDSDISIEDSVKLYKEGINLSLSLNESLNALEKEVSELMRGADGKLGVKPFREVPED